MGDLIVNEFFKMMIFGIRVIFNVLIPLIYHLIMFITRLLVQLFQRQDPTVSAESVMKRATAIWTVVGLVLMAVFLANGVNDARVLFFPLGLAAGGYFVTRQLTQWWVPPEVFQGSGTDMGMLPESLEPTAEGQVAFDPARVDGVLLGQEVDYE